MVSQAKYGCCTKSNPSTRPLWDSCDCGTVLLSADWSSFSQSEDILSSVSLILEELLIRTYNLCLLGVGNVNRTLLRLLCSREQELQERYGIAWKITGVASRRLGWIANGEGLPTLPAADGAAFEDNGSKLNGVREWLRAAE